MTCDEERAHARVTLHPMLRALAMVAGCIVCVAGPALARADVIDKNVATLNDASESYKERLASALALSKSHDARAVIALAEALGRDTNATVRRICALSLEKTVDAHTPDDAKAIALDALDKAAAIDSDASVRQSSASALKALGSLRHGHAKKQETHGDKPEVLVKIEPTADQTKAAPADASARLTSAVKGSVEKAGFATSWPGGLPTSTDLERAHSRAYIVASTVKKIDYSKVGRQTQIACTVAIRVAPWSGSDGGEKWEASKAAQAQGSAKATTGSSDRDIKGGVRDCLEAVAEDITSRQILPFLKRLVVAGN
jgi:hypothetical protein